MLIEEFLNYLKNERHYSLHTIKSYQNDLIQFFDISNLDHNLINTINLQDIRDWIICLKSQKKSTRSINRKISSLKTFFNFCKREKYVSTNPVLKIRTLK